LLRHLERVGFTGAPRLAGSGLDADGRELLTFIEGGFTHPGPWSLDGAAAVAQLRAMTDAYGLSAAQRRGFVDRIIEFMVSETAWEADEAGVTPELTSHPMALWAMAWRARAAAWLLRNRRTFENALA
jgi:hypothetical protein